MIDSESRPNFRQIKEKFELFCRAPHIYIQVFYILTTVIISLKIMKKNLFYSKQ